MCLSLLYDLFLKIFGLSPGHDAAKTEGMTAVGQDSKAPLSHGAFFINLVHADATEDIFALIVGFR